MMSPVPETRLSHKRFAEARLFRELLEVFGSNLSEEYSPPIFIAMSG